MATTINLSDPIATWVTKTNTISSDLGTKASLDTTNKTNLVAAINELKVQSEKTDSSTILQLIDANNYLDSNRVDSLIPKRGTDFIDSSISNALFDTRLATKTTANLTEGANLYYTTARADSDAKNAISVTDAGGDGSIAYNSGTGVITYTGPSASEVRAHFSASTGIGLSSGAISNTGVTSIVAGTNIAISGGTGAVTITNNISAGTGLSFSGGTLNINNGAVAGNSSSAISSGSETSFTASTYPTFISGRTNSSSGGDFTVTVGGSGHTLSMRDGDGGTFDTFATFLPPGASISGASFQYVAVQMRPS
tara:strand:+ start:9901 stop:10830 length:930 start_codon:yes stop_codon:yes gene_type:complete